MFTFNVDLGQIIIASLITIVGYFINKTVTQIYDRLDKHETAINTVSNQVQFLIGRSRSKINQ